MPRKQMLIVPVLMASQPANRSTDEQMNVVIQEYASVSSTSSYDIKLIYDASKKIPVWVHDLRIPQFYSNCVVACL